MIYKFAKNPQVVQNDVTIFVGDNAQGYWQEGILTIQSGDVKYYYKDQWYIETALIEEPQPCGDGAVPTLEINNLKIINSHYFPDIQYISNEN
jgi:hypothetical protein